MPATPESQTPISPEPAAQPAPAASAGDGAPPRLVVLDVLRGVAILGILLINIQSFGRLSSEYLNPKALGDPPPLDWFVWVLGHVFADEKFITMLTLLFGAGIVLMAHHARGSAADFEQIFRRRMFWLLVFGLLHGLLLWPGDILAAYAVCGLIAVHFRDRSPRDLALLGLLLLGGTMVLWMLMNAVLVFAVPPDLVQGLAERYWAPTATVVVQEVSRLTFGWLSAAGERAADALATQLWLLASDRLWRMLGLMFLGMALIKTGFLSGAWEGRSYRTVALSGLGVGIPLVLAGLWFNEAVDWDFRYSLFLGRIGNHWGSLGIALAWVALVILLMNRGALRRVGRGLEAVGRLAMSNYIGQSLLCAAVFFGFGLSLFQRLGNVQLLGVVVAIWILQVAVSLGWRRYLGAGPLERLWRRLAA